MPILTPEEMQLLEQDLGDLALIEPDANFREARRKMLLQRKLIAVYGFTSHPKKRNHFNFKIVTKTEEGEVKTKGQVDLSGSSPIYSQKSKKNPKQFKLIKNIKAFFASLFKKSQKKINNNTEKPIAVKPVYGKVPNVSVGQYGTPSREQPTNDSNTPQSSYDTASTELPKSNIYTAAPLAPHSPPPQKTYSREEIDITNKLYDQYVQLDKVPKAFPLIEPGIKALEKEYKTKDPTAKDLSVKYNGLTQEKPPKLIFFIEKNHTLLKRVFSTGELARYIVQQKSIFTAPAAFFNKGAAVRALPLNPDQKEKVEKGLEILKTLHPTAVITSKVSMKEGKPQYEYSISINKTKPFLRTFTDKSMDEFLKNPTLGPAPPVPPRSK